MSFWSRHLGSSTIAIFITGSAAWADVTAQQVWTDFKSYLEDFGYSVEGTEDVAGDTVTITGLTLTFDSPQDGTTASMAMDNLIFAETGDGRVEVTMPERMPLAFTLTPPADQPEGEDVSGTVDYTQQGFSMVVSGDPENMVYTYDAAEMAFTLTGLIVDGQPVTIDEAVMRLTDVAGENSMSGTDLRSSAQTMTAAALSYVLDMANPEDPTGRISFAGGLENFAFDGTVSLPADADMNDLPAAMREGFAVDGGYSYEGGSSDISVTGQGQTFEGNTSSDAGRLTVKMDGTQIA